jgi:branched-chain amino acid transport system substrate-binding protein
MKEVKDGKMRKGKYLLFAAILLVAILALPAISACAPGAAPPPKEKVITYLSLADYTGPIAGLNVPADMGCEDMFKEINATGGVDGIQCNFIGVDTRYDTARGVSAYKRYRTEPKLLVVNAISTAFGKAIMPMTAKDKVVQLAPGDGEAQAKIGWVFPWGVCYQNAFGATIDFILKDWKDKGNAGSPVVGYMCWDSAYGREPLRGGAEYAAKLGVNLLPPEFFPTGAPDHTVYLTRLAQGGAQYIIIGGVDPTPSNILRDAYKMGLTKTIQFVDSTFWGPAEAVGVKLHPEATEGCWVCSFYTRGDEAWQHPLALKMVPKYRGVSVDEFRKTTAANYVTGMVWALAYQEAAKIALAAVSYDKLDGEAMKTGYESLTGMDIGQGMEGPITYSPTNRQGTDVVKFYQVQNGKLVDISGWVKVPDCVALHDWSKD